MENSLSIRQCGLADKEALVRLWERCELRVPHNDPWKDIDRKFAEQPELFLAGEIGGNLVACCMAGYEGHRGSIYYLGVDPDFQGLGVGRGMMAEAERLLIERGCPKINLMVRESNTEVISFYERIGYQRDPVVVMGKRLISDI